MGDRAQSEKTIGGEVAGTVIGGAAGAWLGSSMGIAAFGTAFTGIVPIAIIGGYIGYKIAKSIKESGGDSPRDDAANDPN